VEEANKGVHEAIATLHVIRIFICQYTLNKVDESLIINT